MKNVLCVDNSATIRKIVKDCVEDLNFNYFDAENGRVCLGKAKEIKDLDLIILDWNMPVVSGRETLIGLKNDAVTKEVDVLVLIKIENKDQVMNVIDLGASNYMLKPFRVNDLQDKIKEMMNDAV